MKSKTFFLVMITFFLWGLNGCSKDNSAPEDPLAKLPPETQTGANTFGCIINGQVFYPRDGTSSLFNPGGRGLIFWGSGNGPNYTWNELEIRNLKDGLPCSRMIIHLQGLSATKVGAYNMKLSNFQNSIDGLMQNYVFAKIFDITTKTWKLYGSYENSGVVNITKYDNIISGNFMAPTKIQER